MVIPADGCPTADGSWVGIKPIGGGVLAHSTIPTLRQLVDLEANVVDGPLDLRSPLLKHRHRGLDRSDALMVQLDYGDTLSHSASCPARQSSRIRFLLGELLLHLLKNDLHLRIHGAVTPL